MPVEIVSNDLPLSAGQIERLWKEVSIYTNTSDEVVAIRAVSPEEIRTLNSTYRSKDKPTNVLTFSYPAVAGTSEGGEHDVAICLSVAGEEAKERNMDMATYVALLLVHAFLHAKGMDHERSPKEALSTQEAEKAILQASGFTGLSL